jgi:hypothetical protein
MLLNKLKKLVPHLVAVFLFAIISLVYFSPLLEGKRLGQQHDIKMYQGMAKEINDYRVKTGQEPLWTNSMFGGMPAYQISTLYKGNVAQFFNNHLALHLPIPAKFLFLSLLGFYILLLVFKVDPWLSFAGALAFGFSSYFFIIEMAGHNTKAHAMAYMAPVIAGFLLTFRGKYILGGLLTTLFLALQLNANHVQITYYTLMIVFVLGVFEFSYAIKNKTWSIFIKAASTLLVAMIIAVGVNFSGLYTTYEYGKYSTRGKSELTAQSTDQTSGLDRSYILNDYSYGIAETFDLFIPNFVGAGANELDTNSETYKYLKSINYGEASNFIKQVPLYWGAQRFTAGPVYIGAVVIFLFVLGLFTVKGKIKWWLVSATVLSILLAWGNNLEFISNFFIDFVPGYNKFRTVSMILVIAEVCMPLLGIIGLQKILSDELQATEKMKALRNAAAIVGGLALIFWILPGVFFNFEASYDSQLKSSGWPEQLLEALRSDRQSVLKADAFRSLLFVVLAAGILFAYLKNKLAAKWTAVAFAVLFVADLGVVGKRYLNSKHFSPKHEAANPFQPSQADQMILADSTLDYRVANLGVDVFNDASTSYYHKSIGGYHGAKLKRYQELIERHISPEINSIYTVFNKNVTAQALDSLFATLDVINMLNTKYFIYSPNAAPLLNSHAFGNAWFAKSCKWVKNADEEITALGKENLKDEVIIDQRFNNIIGNVTPKADSTASIKLAEYKPNYLLYKTKATSDQLAVFSEIYYDKGWNAFIDGKPVKYVRANYVLRAMVVPAGEHSIEYRFEPQSYAMSEKISLTSSILLLLVVLGGLGFEVYKQVKEEK